MTALRRPRSATCQKRLWYWRGMGGDGGDVIGGGGDVVNGGGEILADVLEECHSQYFDVN